MSKNTNPVNSLRALAESGTEGINKNTTFRIDPALVLFEKGFNLREENPEVEEHINRLAAVMEQGAFIPPIDVIVVDGKVICRDGHCRTKAARKVKKKNPEFLLECRQLRGNDADALLHMLGTGSGQRPLTPLEQGRGYLRLLKFGMNPQQIADKLGVSRPTVDNGIALAEAPADVQKLIVDGDVSATTARKVVKQGAEAVKALKDTVAAKKAAPATTKKKKVTAKHLKDTAAAPKKKKAESPPAGKDDVTITVKKGMALATLEYLQAHADDIPDGVTSFVDALELATM